MPMQEAELSEGGQNLHYPFTKVHVKVGIVTTDTNDHLPRIVADPDRAAVDRLIPPWLTNMPASAVVPVFLA